MTPGNANRRLRSCSKGHVELYALDVVRLFLAVIVGLHVQDHVVEVIVAYQREVVFEYVRIGDRVCRGF